MRILRLSVCRLTVKVSSRFDRGALREKTPQSGLTWRGVLMATLTMLRKSTPVGGRGATTGALALAIVLTVFASQVGRAQTFNVIHNFTGGRDGATPYAGLTVDKAGSLYGTAYNGGTGYGSVYKLQHKGAGWTFNPLYSFAGGSDGANPWARVIFGPDGVLYGTTLFGGSADGTGTLFKLRPQPRACTSALCPWAKTLICNFAQGQCDGALPRGDLLFDQTGNLYGTNGGGAGIVYQLKPSGGGWTDNILYAFSGPDGAYPNSGVIFDSAGNVYGTAYGGGPFTYGAVFQLVSSAGWAQNLIYSFRNLDDGGYPAAGLIFDQAGNLYGASSNGGTGGGGTIFELSPGVGGTWTFTVLYSFAGGYQCGPWGALVMDTVGNLYGTTACDGKYGFGDVFELSPGSGGWTYTNLYDFTGGTDGANPISNVLLHPNGKLYGTASAGGSQGLGAVWEIAP